MINSIEEAIELTAKKECYKDLDKELVTENLINEINRGNYNCITKQNGAREFVIKFCSPIRQQEIVEDFDLTDLTHLIDCVLFSKNLNKNSKEAIDCIRDELTNVLNGKEITVENHVLNRNTLEKIIINAASLYSKQNENQEQTFRKCYFDTPNMTRKEATDITNVYANMEHQKDLIMDQIDKNLEYKKIMMDNLIAYCYYENNFSERPKSLKEQIDECNRNK